jgi:hypothetical protein
MATPLGIQVSAQLSALCIVINYPQAPCHQLAARVVGGDQTVTEAELNTLIEYLEAQPLAR